MLFEFRCVNCDDILRANSRFIGRMSRCPHCRNRLIVPPVDDQCVVRVLREEAAELPSEEVPPDEDQRPILLITEDQLEPSNVHEAIRALLQWRFMDVVRAVPVWGVSVGIHAIALLAIATFSYFTLSTPEVAKHIFIPIKASVIPADVPEKPEEFKPDRDATPDFNDVLLHDRPSSPAAGTAMDAALGAGSSGDSPAVMGIEDPLAKAFPTGTGYGVGPVGPEGLGNKVGLIGLEAGGARSVVFIVDASGSMLTGDPGKTRWDVAVQELRDSVQKLTFGHLFNVYFARVLPGPDPFYARWKDVPVIANPANKEECLKFIAGYDDAMHDMGDKARSGQVIFGAGTDIVQSTADALKSSPDVIFLLSDAEFRELVTMKHNPADELRSLNRLRGTRIYTICFKERSGIPIMKRIAEENHGRYKYVP